MANNIAFQPMGNTVVLSASTTASNVSVTSVSPVNQFMIVNTGNVAVFLNFGTASNVSVTAPTVGTPTTSFPVGANSTKVVSNIQSYVTTNNYLAGITASGNATVYVTPGEGL